MRQGRNQRLALIALAGIMLLAGPMVSHAAARESARRNGSTSGAQDESRSTASRSKRAVNTLRQFTGYVSALDKESITVEKRGKKPETRVFTKDDAMSTTGNLEKDSRVTVYFREEGGKSVAHKVVVKAARASSKSQG